MFQQNGSRYLIMLLEVFDVAAHKIQQSSWPFGIWFNVDIQESLLFGHTLPLIELFIGIFTTMSIFNHRRVESVPIKACSHAAHPSFCDDSTEIDNLIPGKSDSNMKSGCFDVCKSEVYSKVTSRYDGFIIA